MVYGVLIGFDADFNPIVRPHTPEETAALAAAIEATAPAL
jgi:hypothetical protein